MDDNKIGLQQTAVLTQEQIQRATHNQVVLGQLLEMNDDELNDRIDSELNDNPALEKSDAEQDANALDYNDGDESKSEDDDPYDSPFNVSDDDTPDSYEGRDAATDEGLGQLKISRPSRGDKAGYEAPVVNEDSMIDVLMNQVRERDLTDKQLMIAEYIIGALDTDGLLRQQLFTICSDIIAKENVFVTQEEVQVVLKEIQDLEPAGIAATSTRECLLYQIGEMRTTNSQAAAVAQRAYTIIDKYFDEYQKHQYSKITEKLAITNDELAQADKVIKKTNPRPGNIFNNSDWKEKGKQITPDFIISTSDDKLDLTVVNDVPELQISESYAVQYKRIVKAEGLVPSRKDENELIKTQYESAANFIELLKNRQEKLFHIMKAIMQAQQEYFITGSPADLKPLRLQDIADATGYDVSTVSRATQNKYVDTNYGIRDLKYFFSTQVGEGDNNSSATATREALRELVENEDKKNPLTDEEMSKQLNISRRTVSKYREMLAIPTARKRRSL